MLKRYYCFLLSALLPVSCLEAQEKMVWSINHWPPLTILEGEDAGKGRFDLLLKQFQMNMPQYQHSTTEMNWNRVWSDIKVGKNVCHMLALKNEKRLQIAYFSKPSSVTLPNRVIMKQSTYESLGEPKSLSLSRLIEQPELKGAIESSRSYTQVLDRIIAKRSEDSELKRYVTSSVQLMKMLAADRFDYLLEYPFIASYMLKDINKPDVRIRSVAIEEIAPYSVVYLACPKTQWGEQRVRDFNAVLDKLVDQPEYIQAMQTWYASDEERQAVFNGFEAVRLQ